MFEGDLLIIFGNPVAAACVFLVAFGIFLRLFFGGAAKVLTARSGVRIEIYAEQPEEIQEKPEAPKAS